MAVRKSQSCHSVQKAMMLQPAQFVGQFRQFAALRVGEAHHRIRATCLSALPTLAPIISCLEFP
jgi:hypothetical protein